MSFRNTGVSAAGAGAVAFVLVLLSVFVAFGGHLPWQHDFELKAVVQSATELSSRSPVRIAGVEVGKVERVQRGPGTTALVTMKIDRTALPIHRDATLKIRPRIFLEGNFFVDLHPGTPGAPDLDSGGTIPLAQTAIPVQFDQILTTLQSSTRADLREVVHTFAQSLDKGGARALRGMLPEWAPAFLDFAQMQQALRGRGEHDLSGFIQSGEKTARALAAQDDSLRELIGGLDRTLQATSDGRAQLAASVGELDRLTEVASPALASLDRAIPPTRGFFRDVRPGIEASPPTLKLANRLATQLQGVLAKPELPAVQAQLTPALPWITSIVPRLSALLGNLTPATECVRTHALPVLETPVDDPPVSTGAKPYRELLYSAVGLASASQNFTGDGQAVRYLSGFGDQTVSTGAVPSVGESLVGTTSEPILGSRPRYTGVKPPFRPDVPCITQKMPDLKAETGPAPRQGRAP